MVLECSGVSRGEKTDEAVRNTCVFVQDVCVCVGVGGGGGGGGGGSIDSHST